MVKKGFSLAEALVVMAIISIFFAAASKIITTRPKPPKQVNQHGYYECYLNVYQTINAAGQQVTVSRPTQRYVRNNVATAAEEVSCSFEPPNGIAFYNINSYGPVFHSSFEPNIKNTIQITFTGAGIILKSDTGTLDLQSNSTQENVKMFLNTLYPDSHIYNNVNIRAGVIISW